MYKCRIRAWVEQLSTNNSPEKHIFSILHGNHENLVAMGNKNCSLTYFYTYGIFNMDVFNSK